MTVYVIPMGLGALLGPALAMPRTVLGHSMVPTLHPNDVVLELRGVYGLSVGPWTISTGTPAHGDVVGIRLRNEARGMVKRVVGLPGDVIEMREGLLYVDGELVSYGHTESVGTAADGRAERSRSTDWQYAFLIEHARTPSYDPTSGTWGPLLVPDDQYFVLGDNRDRSRDSRDLGFIPIDEITGRIVAVLWHAR